MVDVSEKPVTRRTAHARAVVRLGPAIMARLEDGELHGPKGPVFQTAIIAGTMAVKNTAQWIAFCHPLPVEHCAITLRPAGEFVVVRCQVATTGKTGVEMEALTGATAAALTLYDMTKALDKGITIRQIQLVSKTGGKSGDYQARR